MIYVADAHSLVWFLTKNNNLGKEALKVFRDADQGNVFVVIPSIVIAEIIYIAENKGRGTEFDDLLKKMDESINYLVYNLNLEVLRNMQKYTKIKEMHDRIIVTTAKIIKAKLISKDEEIIKSGIVETVW